MKVIQSHYHSPSQKGWHSWVKHLTARVPSAVEMHVSMCRGDFQLFRVRGDQAF